NHQKPIPPSAAEPLRNPKSALRNPMSAVVPEPIRYFDRYRKTIETERVYGEKWLRWANDSTTGRWAVSVLLRRAFFSRLYGFRMNKRISSQKVLPFVIDYNLDADEF